MNYIKAKYTIPGRSYTFKTEDSVKAGDTVKMKAGCKHTVLADTELQIIEVQFGKDINVCDKHKYNFSF